MRVVRKELMEHVRRFSLIREALGPEEGERIYNRWYHSGHDDIFWGIANVVGRRIIEDGLY